MGCDLYQHQQSFKRGGSEGVVVHMLRSSSVRGDYNEIVSETGFWGFTRRLQSELTLRKSSSLLDGKTRRFWQEQTVATIRMRC